MFDLPMDDPLKGWEFQDESNMSSKNMLRVLESKIMNPLKLTSSIKHRRPLTGRSIHSAQNNYQSTETLGKNIKPHVKDKQRSNDQNQNPIEKQKKDASLYLKEKIKQKKKQKQIRQKQRNLLKFSSENVTSKTQKINFKTLEGEIQTIQPQNQKKKEIIFKIKTGQEVPMKKQSLIFNSYQTLKSKNSNKNENGVSRFHEMQIKMRKVKPKQEKNTRKQILMNPIAYRSIKDTRTYNQDLVESINSNIGLQGYTSYSHRKKQENQEKKKLMTSRTAQMRNNGQKSSQIFCDLHFSEKFSEHFTNSNF